LEPSVSSVGSRSRTGLRGSFDGLRCRHSFAIGLSQRSRGIIVWGPVVDRSRHIDAFHEERPSGDGA
jgi:hypothetical protein